MNLRSTEMVDMEKTVMEVRGLTKRFGEVQAVDDLDFTVSRGELFGFLGPNGAGKTTTINLLTGLARPDAGAIRIGGIDCAGDPKAAQHLMGVVPDESNLYPELSGFENLCFCGALYGMPRRERETRARNLLQQFGLAEAAARKFGGYSRGMKRKLTIAAGIMHGPHILFLDEPTTGIDVAGARQLRQLITDLNRSGTTIFLTTHYIEEAERLCRRVAFIVKGRVVRTDTVESLLQQTEGRHVVRFAVIGEAAGLCEAVHGEFSQLQCTVVSEDAFLVESSGPVRIGPLVRFIEERGMEVAEARKVQLSLEEIFVRITGIETIAMELEKEKKMPEGGA